MHPIKKNHIKKFIVWITSNRLWVNKSRVQCVAAENSRQSFRERCNHLVRRKGACIKSHVCLCIWGTENVQQIKYSSSEHGCVNWYLMRILWRHLFLNVNENLYEFLNHSLSSKRISCISNLMSFRWFNADCAISSNEILSSLGLSCTFRN